LIVLKILRQQLFFTVYQIIKKNDRERSEEMSPW